YDIKPEKFGLADNFLTFADNVGGAYNKFNGADVTVIARMRSVTIQGGTSSGNVVEDTCGVSRSHPEYNIFAPWGGSRAFFDTFNATNIWQWAQTVCHRESGWKPNVKGLAVYDVPKIEYSSAGRSAACRIPATSSPRCKARALADRRLPSTSPVPSTRRLSGGRSAAETSS